MICCSVSSDRKDDQNQGMPHGIHNSFMKAN
jgi:hypothetical protein